MLCHAPTAPVTRSLHTFTPSSSFLPGLNRLNTKSGTPTSKLPPAYGVVTAGRLISHVSGPANNNRRNPQSASGVNVNRVDRTVIYHDANGGTETPTTTPYLCMRVASCQDSGGALIRAKRCTARVESHQPTSTLATLVTLDMGTPCSIFGLYARSSG